MDIKKIENEYLIICDIEEINEIYWALKYEAEYKYEYMLDILRNYINDIN